MTKKPSDDDLYVIINQLHDFHPDAEDYQAAQSVKAFLEAELRKRQARKNFKAQNVPA